MKITSRSLTQISLMVFAAVFLTGASARPAQRTPLAPAGMRFVYKSFDGEVNSVCTHRLLSEASPFDWKIECFPGTTNAREYVAHLALSLYGHPDESLSIELLYWLTGSKLPHEVGSTTWFHFASKSVLTGISSSQTVEAGTAGLYLEIGSAGLRGARKKMRTLRR